MGARITREAGLTLLELMVVVTILSILTISVSLAMRGSRTQATSLERASLFQARVAQLHDQAIYGQSVRGVFVSNTGWRVAHYNDGRWRGSDQEIRWRPAIAFRQTGAVAKPGDPQIVLRPDGRISPFELRFAQGEDRAICRSAGWMPLACDAE